MEEFFSRATFATGRLIYIRRRTSLPLLDFYPDPLIPLSSSSLFPRRGYRRSLPRISPSSLFFPWRKQKTILIYPIPGPIIIKRSTTDDKFLPTMDVRGGEKGDPILVAYAPGDRATGGTRRRSIFLPRPPRRSAKRTTCGDNERVVV